MPYNDAPDSARPAHQSISWLMLALPVIIGASPVLLAFFFFQFGMGGMAGAALSLLGGYLFSFAAGILAIVNGIRYRKFPAALTLSFFGLLISAAALYYEYWRLHRQWD